jgi:TatD DNase family protein
VKRLVDSHSHLQLDQFDADREAVLERARAAGLEAIVVLGVDVPTSEQAIALAERFPEVIATAGCHPHDADSMDADAWRRLDELIRHPRIAAVGEIGLDFYRNLSPREKQLDVFRRQLELAAEVSLPIVVHCRDAQAEIEAIVTEWAGQRRRGGFEGLLGIMHYFSGDPTLARRYVEMGFLISIHGSVTYPRAERLREVAADIPIDSLVLETDAPYGAPQSRRGRRNEPAYLAETAEFVATLRGEPIDTVARVTGEIAARLFGRDVTQEPLRMGERAW